MNEPSSARKLASVAIRVRWRDLDAYNHVNNATFLSYLEEARLVWLHGLHGEWHSPTCSPVIASCQIDFRRSIEWPGEVLVEIFREKLGNSSLTLSHRVLSADGEQLYCEAGVVLVWINPASGRPTALPDVVRAACA
jgi:acyl-CoA thioester hydrolase